MDSVTATIAQDGVITLTATASFADGKTELGTYTYVETTAQRTVAVRNTLIAVLASKINAQKALLVEQHSFVITQCEIIRAGIQEAV